MTLPRFACSLTVPSAATIYGTGTVFTGSAQTVTINAGTYWIDSVYAADKNDASPCALSRLCFDIDDVGSACTKSYNGTGYYRTCTLDPSSTLTIRLEPQHANTNAAGREFLRRIGFSVVNNSPAAAATSVTSGPMIGHWTPDRGESGDTDEQVEALATTTRTMGGYAYSSCFGSPIYRREVAFSGLSGTNTKRRTGQSISLASPVTAFEALLWAPLALGEHVRYYADSNATATFLTSALAVTATSATVASTTGLSDNSVCWIDGELCTVVSVSGGTTLNVDRYNPVSHSAYAPVSTSFVGTYALDNDGGNANMGGFSAKRRAYNQDRWDVVMPLVRAQQL